MNVWKVPSFHIVDTKHLCLLYTVPLEVKQIWIKRCFHTRLMPQLASYNYALGGIFSPFYLSKTFLFCQNEVFFYNYIIVYNTIAHIGDFSFFKDLRGFFIFIF